MQWMIMKLRDLGKNGFKIIQNWRTVVLAIIVLILVDIGFSRLSTGEVVLAIIFLILVSILIWVGYILHTTGRWPDWTGFGGYISPSVPQGKTFQRGKTLWDLMQLLIIPAILTSGVYWLNDSARQSERSIADQRAQIERNISSDNMQEAALQNYLDRMAELLLKEKLRESENVSEVRAVARARTLTVLQRLDKERKGALLRFLYEANLIQKDRIVIDLSRADLNGANLGRANLGRANLRGADLSGANLSRADLSRADLSRADLSRADLSSAYLGGADLSSAYLYGANLGWANLGRANLGRANLGRANLGGANLGRANLGGANLSSAYLYGAYLYRADLGGAYLYRADLGGARYTNGVIWENTTWPRDFDPDAAGAIRYDN